MVRYERMTTSPIVEMSPWRDNFIGKCHERSNYSICPYLHSLIDCYEICAHSLFDLDWFYYHPDQHLAAHLGIGKAKWSGSFDSFLPSVVIVWNQNRWIQNQISPKKLWIIGQSILWILPASLRMQRHILETMQMLMKWLTKWANNKRSPSDISAISQQKRSSSKT